MRSGVTHILVFYVDIILILVLGFYSASYPMGTGGSFPGGKATGALS
jgi:hypothetical protein